MKAVRRARQTKKATFLLPEDLLRAVETAVATGIAPSKNAFIARAIDHELVKVRRLERLARLEAASRHPLFLRDIGDVERDFRFEDADTAPETG